ncbi:MAG TPA: hypothetical protein VJH71_00190 [Candidatus Paceibacterota bacterium]
MPTSTSPKDFVTQAEQKYGKKAGLAIKILLGMLGIFAIASFGPTVVAALETVRQIVTEAVFLSGMFAAILLLFAFVKAMWPVIVDQYHGIIKKLTKVAITINPIERLEAYANEYLNSRLEMVDQSVDFVRAKKNEQADRKEKMEGQLEEAVESARALQSRNYVSGKWTNEEAAETFRMLSERIDMFRNTLAKYEKMDKRYELFMALLTKIRRAFDMSIQRTRFTVEMVSNEFEAARSMAVTTQVVGGVVQGTDERTLLANQTLAYVNQSIAHDIARVEGFFERTREFIQTAALQGDVAEDRLLTELNSMSAETDQAIVNLEGAGSGAEVVERVRALSSMDSASVRASMPSGDRKYQDLLRRVRK